MSERELQLRIVLREVPPRLRDAEQIQVDLVAKHRAQELLVLRPRRFIDLDAHLLEELLELLHHRIIDHEIGTELAGRAIEAARDPRIAPSRETLRKAVR